MKKSLSLFVFLVVLFLGAQAFAVDIYPPWPCGRTYPITQGAFGPFSHAGQWAWDVGMGVGTELAAPADGVILYAKGNSNTGCCNSSCSNYANYIVLKMDNGYTAAFWHLAYNGIIKGVGTRVRRGEVIARSGQTGWSCGAHLHFQVQTNCGRAWCPTVQANWVGFGNPSAGTNITSNNCGCVPSTEVCDGKDNDCDGQVDEGNVCCQKTLDFEICDGKDNDCNGQTDEGDVCAGELTARLHATRFDRTRTDIDGDNKMDYCARSSFGFHCHFSSKGALNTEDNVIALSNANGWNVEHYYQTIHMADINGDGKADVCARGGAGLGCWLSKGTSFEQTTGVNDFADAGGWANTRYYSTMRFADINGDGKDDVCARWGSDYGCLPSTGSGFGPRIGLGDFGDKDGWTLPLYYGTIQPADINGDGKYDICGRGSGGIVCFISQGDKFGPVVGGPAWSNANGWGNMQYWATIQFGDINGDGKDDVCGRDNAGVICHISTGTGFGPAIRATDWADASGWADPSNYMTIQLADINGDKKMDVCGKADVAVSCVLSQGDKFGPGVAGPPLTDADKWGDPNHYRSIRFGDFNGDRKADLCARHHSGVLCYPSTGNGFGEAVPGAGWKDEHGWSAEQHAFTFKFNGVSPCTPQCSGKACGPDGCGQTCGQCKSNEECTNEGVCLCIPDCKQSACGSDGCGGSCGTCPKMHNCEEKQCVCIPQCENKTCGSDSCGGLCGTCDGDTFCENGTCQTCTPKCEDKVCGPDGCGGLCGSCEADTFCEHGQCVSGTCTPQCENKACGPDGCGSVCGICKGSDYCDNGSCKACARKCDNKTCGPDGCGGVCGLCDDAAHCNAGVCQESCIPQDEVCDGTDNNCDGQIDEGAVCVDCPYGVDIDGKCILEIPVQPDIELVEGCGCQVHSSTHKNHTMLLTALGMLAALFLIRRRKTRLTARER